MPQAATTPLCVETPDEPSVRPELAEEAALIRKVTLGDTHAARQLVDTHLPKLMGFAQRMIGDAAEAEDVAQEAFLRLWRDAAGWEPKARISTWLHRVVHNLCIDRLRSRRGVSLDDLADREDPADLPAQQLEHHQRHRAVNMALAELPERQRAAITLVYHQEMSNQEAAFVLGIHIDALESLLVRARQNLRRRLVAETQGAGQ